MRDEDKYTLRLDLDIQNREKALELIIERLRFLDINSIFDIDNVYQIYLLKKTNYSSKIYLDIPIENPLFICFLESIMGSDYRKQAIAVKNYYMLNETTYYNRLFDVKKYDDSYYIEADKEDVTKLVVDRVKNGDE